MTRSEWQAGLGQTGVLLKSSLLTGHNLGVRVVPADGAIAVLQSSKKVGGGTVQGSPDRGAAYTTLLVRCETLVSCTAPGPCTAVNLQVRTSLGETYKADPSDVHAPWSSDIQNRAYAAGHAMGPQAGREDPRFTTYWSVYSSAVPVTQSACGSSARRTPGGVSPGLLIDDGW